MRNATSESLKGLNILEPDTRWKKTREVAKRVKLEELQEKVKARAKPPNYPGPGSVEWEKRDRIESRRIVFMIAPNTKPRQTRSDKWKQRKCVMQYRAFADRLRHDAKNLMYSLGDTLIVDFIVPMPATWSKKKKGEMDGMPHQQTPDIDNYIKAFFDALSKQDKSVWKVAASKRWGYVGKIEVTV